MLYFLQIKKQDLVKNEFIQNWEWTKSHAVHKYIHMYFNTLTIKPLIQKTLNTENCNTPQHLHMHDIM